MANKLTINDLPREKLPDFWSDNARLNALYAPFRDRSVNARDWDSKLSFWQNIIGTWCEHNKICTISESDLKQCFIQNGRTPACLNIVLSEMYRTQQIQNVNQFMELPQKSWSGWAVDLVVKKPLRWSLGKVKEAITSPIQPDTKFIHISTVRKLSEQLFTSIHEDDRNKILSIDDLSQLSAFKNVDVETLKILLHYLQCSDKVDVLKDFKANGESLKCIMLIKFAKVDTKVAPISNVDIAKYKLEQNEKLLTKKIENMEREKDETYKSVKAYLAKGMRQMAKTTLRKHHELERRLQSQVSTLDNVHQLLGRIGSAESDGEVLHTYRHGLAALKSVFAESGLTEDEVDDTMLQLTEVLDTHDDIQTSLSQPVSTTDADLEEELAELLAEPEPSDSPMPPPPSGGESVDDDFNELQRRLNKLKMPNVPDESPTSSPVKNSLSSV